MKHDYAIGTLDVLKACDACADSSSARVMLKYAGEYCEYGEYCDA